MPPRIRKLNREGIRTYFLRNSAEKEAEETSSDDQKTHVQPDKMAHDTPSQGSIAELKEILMDMKDQMTNEFKSVREAVTELSQKVEGIDFDLNAVKEKQAENSDNIKQVRDEVGHLRQDLLKLQVHNRKYNLLIYGVEGNETAPIEVIQKVREFGKNALKLDEELVKRTAIRNAHRLPKRRTDQGETVEGPAPIIVKFLYWLEREAFLKAGKNLRGTRQSIRSDLPPVLKHKRWELSKIAYKMRSEDGLQTRVREQGTEVWLESRRPEGTMWSRF